MQEVTITITGEPGSGKTTILKYIHQCLFNAGLNDIAINLDKNKLVVNTDLALTQEWRNNHLED